MRNLSFILILCICSSCAETEIRTRELGRTLERKTFDYDPEPSEIYVNFHVEGDKLWGTLYIKQREEYRVEMVKEKDFKRNEKGEFWTHPFAMDVVLALMTLGIAPIIQISDLTYQFITNGEIERYEEIDRKEIKEGSSDLSLFKEGKYGVSAYGSDDIMILRDPYFHIDLKDYRNANSFSYSIHKNSKLIYSDTVYFGSNQIKGNSKIYDSIVRRVKQEEENENQRKYAERKREEEKYEQKRLVFQNYFNRNLIFVGQLSNCRKDKLLKVESWEKSSSAEYCRYRDEGSFDEKVSYVNIYYVNTNCEVKVDGGSYEDKRRILIRINKAGKMSADSPIDCVP